MTPEASERFGVGKGRERPPFQPKDIHCPSCGAGLTVKNEASELVVCEYCGGHIDAGEPELKVLGKGAQKKWDFPLSLGDSFRNKGARFEILARIAYTEDNDPTELTREYYLFHPTRGAMWLSEYKGNYSVSHPSHVATTEDPFPKKRGDLVKTHDGQKWVMEETGLYSLVYVDGALPWLAKIGDQIRYAEATEVGGSGRQLEIQAQGSEIEIGIGRTMPVGAVASAMGKPELAQRVQTQLVDTAKKRRGFLLMIKLAAAAMLLNLVLWGLCLSSGSQVLGQRFNAAELTGETLSEPFNVSTSDRAIKVNVHGGNLSNAWMAIDLALVKGDDAVIHTLEADLEYYHGYEGGESWSEGSTSKTKYIFVPEAGTYHILVHASCGSGSNPEAEPCPGPVALKVTEGVWVPSFFLYGFFASLISLIIAVKTYSQWKEGEE